MIDQEIFKKDNKTNSHIFIRYPDESYFCIKYNQEKGIRISCQDVNKNRKVLTILETKHLVESLTFVLDTISELMWVFDIESILLSGGGDEYVEYKKEPIIELLNKIKLNKPVRKPTKELDIYYTINNGEVSYTHIYEHKPINWYKVFFIIICMLNIFNAVMMYHYNFNY